MKAVTENSMPFGAVMILLTSGIAPAQQCNPAGQGTFTQVYSDVIVPSCHNCHSGAVISGNLDLGTQSSAYANLINVAASGTSTYPSCASTHEVLVVPGNAANSLLYQKVVETSPPCGAQMPVGGLSQTQADEIMNWINAGALNN